MERRKPIFAEPGPGPAHNMLSNVMAGGKPQKFGETALPSVHTNNFGTKSVKGHGMADTGIYRRVCFATHVFRDAH
eukprot:306728-Rhodomonas_salina.2